MVLLAMAALTIVGCARISAPTPTPTPLAVATQTSEGAGPRSGAGTVAASGEIVPAQEAHPGFTMSGRVAALTVAEGDEVETGETLATLESGGLEADVAQTEAALALAKAELARVKAGPRPGEIAAATAQVEAARSALAEATARRDQLTAGAREAEVAAAQAQLVAARAEALSARIAYDQLQERKREDRKKVKDWEEEEALLRHRAAERSCLAAEAQVAQAEERARVQVRAAGAAVSTAEAQLDIAQAQLDLLQAGPTPEEIAVAQAAVTQAESALEGTRTALDQATLHATFAGAVTAVAVGPGETVMPGQGVVTLANLRHLQVETTDLSERDVVRVAPGQAATVYVEALGAQIRGRVADIAPRADTMGGDVVFAVTIALDDQPRELLWGMSVEVEIEVQ
jgi:multidrug efflux pump subunit AcrA (membrane-fusion protein)